ncbi:Caleosin-domain-containing protein [Acaromyces ingoldii]|uniref:Caleosin-domain-containing protein n=1 Tax=Acaromyces ingoldii TaxID=215250 RepID=A0A316YXV5_9BASI|nr:Caleosin-domain-containing protein [Acaromyces ingoldii]PWN93584.1 Caleosin-domain-containing protein [Acaromyces ingoldii]
MTTKGFQICYHQGNTFAKPNGDAEDYRNNTKNLTSLQAHIAFFDADCDGIIWPLDTFLGFLSLGFGLPFSLMAGILINGAFSYPSKPRHGILGWLPDPFFRIWIRNIRHCKHGSDLDIYSHQGQFQPDSFRALLERYSSRANKEELSFWDTLGSLREEGDLYDFVGMIIFALEWFSVYVFLRPESGYMKKDDILGVLDGSMFPVIALRNRRNHHLIQPLRPFAVLLGLVRSLF